VPGETRQVTGSASPGAGFGTDFSQVPVHASDAARAPATQVARAPSGLLASGLLHPPGVPVTGAATWPGGFPSLAMERARRKPKPPLLGGAPAGAAPVRARPPTAPARLIPRVLRGSGQPLHAPVREEMEARFGADFSQVRVHTGDAARASAADLGARAYTSGRHIVIGDGGSDKRTLAHELSHVIQQRQGPVAGTDHRHGFKVSDPSDRDEKTGKMRRKLGGP